MAGVDIGAFPSAYARSGMKVVLTAKAAPLPCAGAHGELFLVAGNRPPRLSIPDVNERHGDRQDETNHEAAQEAAAEPSMFIPEDLARAREAARRGPMTPRRLGIIAANRCFIERLWRAAGDGLSGPDRTGKTLGFPCIGAPFEAKSAAVFAKAL